MEYRNYTKNEENLVVREIKTVVMPIFVLGLGVLAGWLVFTYTTLASMQIAIIVSVAVGAAVSLSVGLFFLYFALRERKRAKKRVIFYLSQSYEKEKSEFITCLKKIGIIVLTLTSGVTVGVLVFNWLYPLLALMGLTIAVAIVVAIIVSLSSPLLLFTLFYVNLKNDYKVDLDRYLNRLFYLGKNRNAIYFKASVALMLILAPGMAVGYLLFLALHTVLVSLEMLIAIVITSGVIVSLGTPFIVIYLNRNKKLLSKLVDFLEIIITLVAVIACGSIIGGAMFTVFNVALASSSLVGNVILIISILISLITPLIVIYFTIGKEGRAWHSFFEELPNTRWMVCLYLIFILSLGLIGGELTFPYLYVILGQAVAIAISIAIGVVISLGFAFIFYLFHKKLFLSKREFDYKHAELKDEEFSRENNPYYALRLDDEIYVEVENFESKFTSTSILLPAPTEVSPDSNKIEVSSNEVSDHNEEIELDNSEPASSELLYSIDLWKQRAEAAEEKQKMLEESHKTISLTLDTHKSELKKLNDASIEKDIWINKLTTANDELHKKTNELEEKLKPFTESQAKENKEAPNAISQFFLFWTQSSRDKIDKKLNLIVNTKAFKAIDPCLDTENLEDIVYIKKCVMGEKWLKKYHAPHKEARYAPFIYPKIIINKTKKSYTLKNSVKHHTNFCVTFPFDFSVSKLNSFVWQGEEQAQIAYKSFHTETLPNGDVERTKIEWNKTLYTYVNRHGKVIKNCFTYDLYERYSYGYHVPYERYSDGFIGALWIGSVNKGLLYNAIELSKFITRLNQVEQTLSVKLSTLSKK